MRKFKVVKKWPAGPEVGEIGEFDTKIVIFRSPFCRWYPLSELNGLVEEINEQEGFWFINDFDKVENSVQFDWSDRIPKHLRFRSKEAAQKFAYALKDSLGINLNKSYDAIDLIIDSLNDRITD